MMNLSSEKICLKRLHYNDVDEWLNFARHYSFPKMKQAFAKVGVLVEDDSDIEALSRLSKSQGDINGELKDKNGKSIHFRVIDVVKSIDDDVVLLDKKFVPTKGNCLLKVHRANH